MKEIILVVRRFLKLVIRTYIVFSIIVLIYTFAIACSPTNKNDNDINIAAISKIEQSDKSHLEALYHLWIEEKGKNGDQFTAGQAAYDIARLTGDLKWSAQAIELLNNAREEMPQFSLATAYLGAAHALTARDFPLRGLWQVFPGPGFTRMYHVHKAKTLLNEAFEKDSINPIVCLLRASTIINMPSILVNHDTALDDFELLAKWDENPSSNPNFADVLGSVEWRKGFYYNYAETLLELGETERANLYQEKFKFLLR